MGDADALLDGRRAPPARPGRGRRAHAADPHRRRAAGRAADARALAGGGILVLSQYVEERYATELLGVDTAGLGYLLKDRIADVAEFMEAVRRVGEGGTALDPEVVAQLLARTRRRDPLAACRPRARGAGPDGRGPLERRHRRRPGGVGRRGREARHQHLHQARPAADDAGHRRVLAVLRWLES